MFKVLPSDKDVQELCHKIGTTFRSKKKRRQVSFFVFINKKISENCKFYFFLKLESFLGKSENFANILNLIPALKQDPVSNSNQID